MFSQVERNPITKMDPSGLKFMDGMNCNVIGRKIVPSLSSGETFPTESIEDKTIFKSIATEYTLFCACYGEGMEAIVELLNDRDILVLSFMEKFIEDCTPVTKLSARTAESKRKELYKPMPGGGKVIIFRETTNAQGTTPVNIKDQWSSACPNSVGKPM